jgi:hypothetical protein
MPYLTQLLPGFSPIVTATSSFNNFAADGYLGLAYPSLSRMNQPSVSLGDDKATQREC